MEIEEFFIFKDVFICKLAEVRRAQVGLVYLANFIVDVSYFVELGLLLSSV